MNVRHVNRVTTAPTRNTEEGQPDYRSRSAARAAAGRRRYSAADRADVIGARPAPGLAAVRASLAAMGFTADSPAVLGPEGEQIARAERRS
jgi:hypothetical protein